jgi:hypothetical protein
MQSRDLVFAIIPKWMQSRVANIVSKGCAPSVPRTVAWGSSAARPASLRSGRFTPRWNETMKMYVLAPKTHSRQALFLTLMAVVFVGFGYFSEFRFMSAYLIIFGVVLLCGAAFSVLNSRRIAKITSSDRA